MLFAFLAVGSGLAPLAPGAWAQSEAPKTLSLDKVSPDIIMVVSAIVVQMRGQQPPKGDWPDVVFAPGVAQNLSEPPFFYDGFRLLPYMVSAFERFGENSRQARIKGFLHFLDGIGRRALVAYEAEYEIGRERLLVGKARISPVQPERPEVRLFVVPAEKVTHAALLGTWNNARAFEFASENAVPLDRPGAVPKGVRDYYLFSFFMDRLTPDAKVDLLVSDTAEGLSGLGPNPLVIDHSGWRLLIARGAFALNGAQDVFFKAIYVPGSPVPREERESILAAVFSTKLPTGGYLTVKNANIRSGPSATATKITTLRKGTRVVVLEEAAGGKWYRIAHGGKEIGFIYAPLLHRLR